VAHLPAIFALPKERALKGCPGTEILPYFKYKEMRQTNYFTIQSAFMLCL
jgi:hypothetical protein